tara:strand:+ start:425 stop:889 length:465 start_codon:yes stop_codon:yes gene_type:complete
MEPMISAYSSKRSVEMAIDPNTIDRSVKVGSERSFGLIFAVVFAILVALFWRSSISLAIIFGIFSLLMIGLAFVWPDSLRYPNKAWFVFGQLLHRVISPIVMGFIFFGVVTPMALGLRVLKKDPLKLQLQKGHKTYWEAREPVDEVRNSLTNQF